LLKLSDKKFVTNTEHELRDYIEKNYDIVIVGSDAVWAFQKMKINNPYWLFGETLNCIKMSYAASAHSTDFKKVTEADKNYISNCLKSFSYIGVRDQMTYDFISTLVQNNQIVHRNCDPTILLDPGNRDIAENVLKRFNVKRTKPLSTYMIAGNDYVTDIISQTKEFTSISLYKRNRLKDKFFRINRAKMLYDISPFEWYNMYSISDFNVSNYFHGTIGGLISLAPTIAFDNTSFNSPYIGKIQQVMMDLDLMDFYFHYPTMNVDDQLRLKKKIKEIKENKSEIKDRISNGLINEKLRADSFFVHLAKLLE
jgi:polysaccharide pyruvyl transferase WcaK-like protein